MTLRDLVIGYFAVGAVCAVVVYRKSGPRSARTLASAAATLPLWPLWAPIALGPTRGTLRGREHPSLAKFMRALSEASRALAGTAAEPLLSQAVVASMREEIARVASRLVELDAAIEREGFDLDASRRRLTELENAGPAGQRVLVATRLRHDGCERLRLMRDADARSLEELVELAEALRAQVVLARYRGAPAEGAEQIFHELRLRLEALDEVA
jgi:hypothetical protein